MDQSHCDLAKSLVDGPVKLGAIPEQRVVLGKVYPLVLTPSVEKVNFIEVQEYFRKHHENIIKAASEYGTVMFKGFEIVSGEEWASILYQSSLKEMNYVGGAAVRNLIIGTEGVLTDPQVLTTNESPPSEPIPFHHELAQTPNPPSHICFYCSVNAADGGSTPIIRSDEVYNWLIENYPEAAKKFDELGVRYVRTVPEEDDHSSAQGRSWKSMFHVKTREDAEIEMKKQEFEWEWYDNGNCKVISKVLPAVRVSSNGNKTFFNQVIAAYTGWVDKRNDYGKAVCFGDNSQLDRDIIESLAKFMEEHRCAYKWTPGQFSIIDNTVAYHSRQPFTGRRRVFAAIGLGTKPVVDTTTQLVLTTGAKMPTLGLVGFNDAAAALKMGFRRLECTDLSKLEQADADQVWTTVDIPALGRQSFALDSKVSLVNLDMPVSISEADGKFTIDSCSVAEQYALAEKMVAEGKARHVGLKHFNLVVVRDIMTYAKVKPTVLSVEMHPYFSQTRVLRFCREQGIAVTALYSVQLEEAAGFLNDAAIVSIAKAHGVSARQVVIRWLMQRGASVTVEGLSTEEAASEVFAAKDVRLSCADMAAIDALNKEMRCVQPLQELAAEHKMDIAEACLTIFE